MSSHIYVLHNWNNLSTDTLIYWLTHISTDTPFYLHTFLLTHLFIYTYFYWHTFLLTHLSANTTCLQTHLSTDTPIYWHIFYWHYFYWHYSSTKSIYLLTWYDVIWIVFITFSLHNNNVVSCMTKFHNVIATYWNTSLAFDSVDM